MKTLLKFAAFLALSVHSVHGQAILEQLFQTEIDLVIPPQNFLQNLTLQHKLEKIEIKINQAYWDSIKPRLSDFNRSKWTSFGFSVSEQLDNCSKLDFNFDQTYLVPFCLILASSIRSKFFIIVIWRMFFQCANPSFKCRIS